MATLVLIGNLVSGGGGGSVVSGNITDATATGKAVLTASTPATARAAIGAGTSSLTIGTTGTTAKAGNWAPALDDLPPGSVIAAYWDGTANWKYAGANITARPTARTDISVLWVGGDVAHPPPGALTGTDLWSH